MQYKYYNTNNALLHMHIYVYIYIHGLLSKLIMYYQCSRLARPPNPCHKLGDYVVSVTACHLQGTWIYASHTFTDGDNPINQWFIPWLLTT